MEMKREAAAMTTHVTSTPATRTATPPQQKRAPGLKFSRYFTKPGISPYDEVEWELRTASITDAKGNSIRGIMVCRELAAQLGLHAFEFTNVGSSFMQSLL